MTRKKRMAMIRNSRHYRKLEELERVRGYS
jgi:hypothetical protein